jgi:hypothetical protein
MKKIMLVVPLAFVVLCFLIFYFTAWYSLCSACMFPSDRIVLVNLQCQTGLKRIIEVGNSGKSKVNTSSLIVRLDSSVSECKWSASVINPGKTTVCEIDLNTSKGNHTVKVIGPINAAEGQIFCP